MASTLQVRPSPLAKAALLITPLLGQMLRPVVAAPASAFFSSALDDSKVIGIFRHHAGDGDELPRTTAELAIDISMIAALVLLGGVFAGLTLGLMGMDAVNLKVLSTSGSDVERKHAVKVLRLLDRGRHWVLVVLLLGNVIVNESLPIFLSDFGGGTAAVLTSTFLIVIFGEIVPQSICARHGLAIGAFCAPLVHVLMLVFSPVAWPTAKLLDWALGEDHGTTYRKAELKTFVSLHQQLGTENLNEDEVTIIRAVLDLNDKTVKDVMTPIEDVFTLAADTILDDEGVGKLVQSGYSRVPIHEPGKPDAILGMLLVKKLIAYDPEDSMPVSWFQLTNLPEANPDLTLLDCLNFFQQGRSHMILVSTHPGEPEGALGVVTLEDVIEEMIGEEIVDETDVFVDVHNKIKVRRNKVPTREGGGAWNGLIRGIIERRRSKYSGPTRAPLKNTFGTGKPAGSTALVGQHLPRAVDKVAIKRPGSPSTNTSRHTSVAGSPPFANGSSVLLISTEDGHQPSASPAKGLSHSPQQS